MQIFGKKTKKSGSHEWDFQFFMNRICIEKCNFLFYAYAKNGINFYSTKFLS